MKLRLLALVVLLLPGVQAVSFFEGFEDYNVAGFDPDDKPQQDWYTYRESDDIGVVSAEDPTVGTQSLELDSVDSIQTASFSLVSAGQVTNITFTLRGQTIADNGVGSRQYVQLQSHAPHRSLVEFYVLCNDAAEPDACEFRVRFETIDSRGQVLINTTLGEKTFNVTVVPSWTTASYVLHVNGVNDGSFPFLHLPANFGRLRIAQDTSAYPLDATLDDWFIDGAPEPIGDPDNDVAGKINDLSDDLHFTSPTSRFLFGIFLFIVMVGGVIGGAIGAGRDSTILPCISFFAALVALWLVQMEYFPDWIGISLIITTAAIVSFAVRRFIMGIRDASTDVGLVAGAFGYFIIASLLLGLSGYATEDIELPTGVLETEQDQNETAEKQSYVGAFAECGLNIVTFGQLDLDCTRETKGTTWAKIEDFASTIFNFARTSFTFLFQLLTFQLPISPIFSAMIVFPPAAALATVGFKLILAIRGGG